MAFPEADGTLAMYTGSQNVYDDHHGIKEKLGVSDEQVRVISKYVGGGFGGKEDLSVQHHAALLAWHTRKPVKLTLSRKESILVHPKRHPMEMEFTTACDENGRIMAVKAELIADTRAYASLGKPVLQRGLWYLLVDKEKIKDKVGKNVKEIRIPIFAVHITPDKDSHGFDWTKTAGRLLWYALYDIDIQRIKAGKKLASEKLVVPEYMQKRQIYRNFGLKDDDISSFSHVFAPHFVSGTSPRTLNLREIQSYGKFPMYSALYVFENPAVLSHIIDELIHFLDMNGLSLEQIPKEFPAFLCTSGQPRSAALEFITKCLEANPNCLIRYSGDLDLSGVQMMQGIQGQFTFRFEALRMDDKTYRNYSGANHLRLSFQDKTVLKRMGDELPKVMVELGVKIYQEEFVKDLTEDVLEAIRLEEELY